MVNIKRYGTAGGTVLVAAAIGFFMQNSDATASRIGADASNGEVSFAATTQPVQAGVIVPTPAMPVAPSPAVVDETTNLQDMAPTLAAAPVGVDAPDMDGTPSATPDCTATMSAVPSAAAMVDLALDAPCALNERVTIHHEGMMFTVVTDAAGATTFTAPAMSENAVFIAAFANGEGAMATTTVDSIGFYDRVVLQWRGDTGVQMHAREFGAGYGEDGHVWHDTPRDVSAIVSGTGGFMTTLGDLDTADPMRAEVYTFPTGMSQVTGDVALSVEAEVTAENCGQEIAAQSLQRAAGGERTVLDLVVAMPGCDAIGDFVLLNNMVADLQVAQR